MIVKKKMTKDQGSNMAYMFRLPFMSGNVFSASMIDTLLYQTFGKPYLIELIRLLIGLSQSPGSGNLTSVSLILFFYLKFHFKTFFFK